MAKPRHTHHNFMKISTTHIPHNVMVDSLRIGDYKQVEFDSEELARVIKTQNNELNTNTTDSIINHNLYHNYTNSDFDSDSDSDIEYTDEKGLLPLPVTASRRTRKGSDEGLSSLSKILLVITGLMIVSLTGHYSGFYNMSLVDCTQKPPVTAANIPEYKYTSRLDELYTNFSPEDR